MNDASSKSKGFVQRSRSEGGRSGFSWEIFCSSASNFNQKSVTIWLNIQYNPAERVRNSGFQSSILHFGDAVVANPGFPGSRLRIQSFEQSLKTRNEHAFRVSGSFSGPD